MRNIRLIKNENLLKKFTKYVNDDNLFEGDFEALLNNDEFFNKNWTDLNGKAICVMEYIGEMCEGYRYLGDSNKNKIYKNLFDRFVLWEVKRFADDETLLFLIFNKYTGYQYTGLYDEKRYKNNENQIHLIERCIELNPGDPKYYFYRASLYDRKNFPKTRLHLLKKADSLSQYIPESERMVKDNDLRRELITTYQENEEFKNALEYIRKTHKKGIRSYELYYMEIITLSYLQQLEELDSLMQFIKNQSLNKHEKYILFNDASTAMKSAYFRDYEKSIDYSLEATSYTTNAEELRKLYIKISKAYYFSKEAEKVCEYAIKAYSMNTDGYWNKSNDDYDYIETLVPLILSKEEDEAIKIMEKCDSLFNNIKFKARLYNHYISENLYDDALRKLTELEDFERNNPIWIENKALI